MLCEWMYKCICPLMPGFFTWLPTVWCFIVQQRSWAAVLPAKVVSNDYKELYTTSRSWSNVCTTWLALQNFITFVIVTYIASRTRCSGVHSSWRGQVVTIFLHLPNGSDSSTDRFMLTLLRLSIHVTNYMFLTMLTCYIPREAEQTVLLKVSEMLLQCIGFRSTLTSKLL